jgi:hypothetical protein
MRRGAQRAALASGPLSFGRGRGPGRGVTLASAPNHLPRMKVMSETELARRRRLGGQVLDRVLSMGPVVLGLAAANAYFAGALVLAGDYRTGRSVADLDERLGSVEERLRTLETLVVGQVRLQGVPLYLLAREFEVEIAELWRSLEADEAMAELRISAEDYAKAVRELEYLGLVYIHGNANHASGIARAELTNTAVLRVGPTLFAQIDWMDDVARILASLERDRIPERLFLVSYLQEKTRIPMPRLNLLLRALDEVGVIEAGGPGSHQCGDFMHLDLTTKGRRVLRGDEGFFG